MNLDENIKVEKIGRDKELILKNLMSLYLHDLSEFADDLILNEEGIYEYDGLEYFFSEEELNPFLIYYKDNIAGFVLLTSGKYVPKGADYCIHEIFVSKSYRGKAVATSTVKKLLETYVGKYKVVQLENNKLAISFWKSFYKKLNIEYTENINVVDGFNCYEQLFNS